MRAVVAVPAPCGRCSMFAWHQRRQPFALAGWAEIVRTRGQPSAARLRQCSQPLAGAAGVHEDARAARGCSARRRCVAQPLEDDAQRVVLRSRSAIAARPPRRCQRADNGKFVNAGIPGTRSDRFAAKHQDAVPKVGVLGAPAQHARRVPVVLVPALHESADHGFWPLWIDVAARAL